MTWFNFLGVMAPLLAAGWTLGTLIAYWERRELQGYSPKDKVWTWFWFQKESLMWIWLAAIACSMVLT